MAGLCWGACSPALASCVLLRSRESVPFVGVSSVLLVSSLYRKLVLLFLIYIILTFDQKKKVMLLVHHASENKIQQCDHSFCK